MLVNFLAGTGLFLSAKVPNPWQTGLLFASSLLLNSFPSYYEGFMDIKDEPVSEEQVRRYSQMRKLGFYTLVAGFSMLIVKHKRMFR